MDKECLTMEKIIALCKSRGFIFPGSEIYGGLQNSWDYGPFGVQLINNIKNAWWKFFVESRSDMIGLDSTVIMSPKVWEASGHIENFVDPLVEDTTTHIRYRADQILEENGIDAGGMQLDEIAKIIKEKNIKSPDGNELVPPKQFNLLFKTNIGPIEGGGDAVYLRPELAQGMFVDFPTILRVSRKKIPFGIAQIGKVFRNEITSGNFIFRLREFNLMEFEYFVRPDGWEHAFNMWLEEMKKWFAFLGIEEEKLNYHEVPEKERAHYSKRTVDIQYSYPFGSKELNAIAYRTDYDLRNHMERTRTDMTYTDPDTGEKYIPHVVEPTFGIDRTLLAILCSAYFEEDAPTAGGGTEKRTVLKLQKGLAPVKVGILPLSNKPELTELAKEVWLLLQPHFACEYDETQSIGRRYRRQDEIGTPYCVTVDFESTKDNAVTVRDRDTMKQDRVKIEELVDYLSTHFK
jgi:glycyl-tRNA synthetase